MVLWSDSDAAAVGLSSASSRGARACVSVLSSKDTCPPQWHLACRHCRTPAALTQCQEGDRRRCCCCAGCAGCAQARLQAMEGKILKGAARGGLVELTRVKEEHLKRCEQELHRRWVHHSMSHHGDACCAHGCPLTLQDDSRATGTGSAVHVTHNTCPDGAGTLQWCVCVCA